MTNEERIDLKNEIISDVNLRYCEIYKISNNLNQKIYVGQALSHVLKRKKYIPHGMEGRFQKHLYEALGNSNYKYSCRHLNFALKKYGAENFTLQLIRVCNVEDANRIESEEIIKHNSLSPLGYNLTTTCNSFGSSSIDFVKSVSSGLINSYSDKRIKRLLEYQLIIDQDYEKYIKPKIRNKMQCGWRIRLKDIVNPNIKLLPNKEIEFTSIMSLEEEKNRAKNFLKELYNGNVIKLRETLPESSLPLTTGNVCEELS
jgi:hypothetical protein